MQRLMSAIAAAVALGVVPVSAATAADAQGVHHHRPGHHTGSYYGPNVTANPAVRGGYVMNGAFDWRPLHSGREMPWYAHGYSNDCVAWMKTAPIESAIHDIAVADGRVGDDVGTVRVGVMPGTMMMSALRIGRGSSRNRQHTQRDCRGDCDYKLLHGISSASHV